jgi:tetratricopeptide (TPR) repeat protein
MTRGFRVFSTRFARVTPRVLAAVLMPVLTGLMLLASPSPALAQMTQAQKDEVKLHYQRATRAYDLQKYQEAIDEYQKAYEISGDPPMLYNIAQAYRLADQPAEAVRYYRRFLQRMPNARNRDDVERKIADQEKLAEERRKSEPAAPSQPTQTKPPPIVEVKPPSPVAPSVTSPPVVSPVPPAAEASHTGTVVGWCLIGAGLIVDGVAAYEGYRAKQKADELTRDSMANPPKTFDPSLETDGKNANVAAIALAIGGTAVAIAGAIVLISSGGSSEPDKTTTPVARLSLTPWLSPGLVGGGARLQF